MKSIAYVVKNNINDIPEVLKATKVIYQSDSLHFILSEQRV